MPRADGRQAVQRARVTLDLWRDAPEMALASIPTPPTPWIVKGQRGGHYLAVGEITRRIGEVDDDFMRNTVTIEDRSEGARYLRPAQVRRLLATG